VDSLVLDSITKMMEKNSFLETVRLQMGKGAANAERMSHEMEAVVDTHNEMGISSIMASAAQEKLEWCSQMNLGEYFGGEIPESLDELLDILTERRNG